MAYARSNPHRFTTTRAGKSEIDEEFNTQTGWINDTSRRLDTIETSGISGADNPANAGKVPVTDGYHISWKKVDLSYLTPQSMNDTILQDRSITNRVMSVHSVGSDQLMDNCVVEQKIPHNSLPGTKIRDGTTSLQKLSPSSSVSVMAGSADGNSWVECTLNPWEIATNVPVHARPYGQALNVIWNYTPGTFDGRKLTDNSIPVSKLMQGLAVLPVGGIIPYAGVNLHTFTFDPPGFLTCNGRSVWRDAFPALFAVIGTQYNYSNIPDDQFCLPDLRGRAIFGLCGNLSGTGDAAGRITTATANALNLGGYGGMEQQTLTVDQMPPHAHTHNFPAVRQAGFSGSSLEYSGITPVSTSVSGGGQPHNNMPPFILMNYLIKT